MGFWKWLLKSGASAPSPPYRKKLKPKLAAAPVGKAWYVFYLPRGRVPASFGGKSRWRRPKAYFGPYGSRNEAIADIKHEMVALDEPATRYKFRYLTPEEFTKLWGSPPGADL